MAEQQVTYLCPNVDCPVILYVDRVWADPTNPANAACPYLDCDATGVIVKKDH